MTSNYATCLSQQLLTVIICTHNPQLTYLSRVLEALNAQSLSLLCWELLLIDNASEPPVAESVRLDWHPNARIIREMHLGLIRARLRGVSEAKSDVLVFVDDDNVLDTNYLEIVVQISNQWPNIGAWGGQILPEFEQEPPEWTKPYWWIWAIRVVDADKWSNLFHQYDTNPCGAGLCVRKEVAEAYKKLVLEDERRLALERQGIVLKGCEDLDLAVTACDMGLCTGQFRSLKLTHLIPSSRLEEEYMLSYVEKLSASAIYYNSFRDATTHQLTWCYLLILQLQILYRRLQRLCLSPRKRRFADAALRGSEQATKVLKKIQYGNKIVIRSVFWHAYHSEVPPITWRDR